MYRISANGLSIAIDTESGSLSSLKLGYKERLIGSCPLFRIRFRNKAGECLYTNSSIAKKCSISDTGLTFEDFGDALCSLRVNVTVSGGEEISWDAKVLSVPSEYAVEWIEFPKVLMPALKGNGEGGGKILFPYNEGMLIDDINALPRYEPEFPMSGAYFIFPNMVCSQFMAYLFDSDGLYIGAHDESRGFKGVDFYPCEGGVAMQMRLYSGADFGQDFTPDYPIVWRACSGDWRSACDIYREWFKKNLPPRVTKTAENATLPEWYKGSPLVVTYPVRGIHDMDKMEPNALFPYTNALPILNKIKNATGAQIMALLMHWEGTAPWAPPYVWPPFGGEGVFNEFKNALHAQGDLLGVYCSGFGYTLRSTLIESYNLEEKIKHDGVLKGVCHSPKNTPELGITCTPYQRYGYDICPASEKGHKILDEAYSPLFSSGIDYMQVLDQNHGGGQYMCYAREHSHPPMPGAWMTSNMQELLNNWNERASGMLFGCESAAAEPFIGNLLMSDNRYELNYPFGDVVPIYAYLYHEYVRNFMGNQCGCPFEPSVDTLRYRLAYSFSIGDIMTLVLAPNGDFMTHWGTHDFEHAPNTEKTLAFIKNMINFYNKDAKKYLLGGKMTAAPEIECESIDVPLFRGRKLATLPRLLSSYWKAENGKVAYIVVNPNDAPVEFSINGEVFEAPALDALLIIR